MEFDEIWRQFGSVIDDMKDGMEFFEGYIPAIDGKLLAPITTLVGRSRNHDFATSTWSNETTKSDWGKEYSPPEYVAFFQSDRIVTLQLSYTARIRHTDLFLKLMFDKHGTETALEIICYREPILESADPKEAIKSAISELRYLNHLFGGNALFIGPDTLDYPASATDYPDLWLKIE